MAHVPVYLPPFAMWPAFPTSDYYGGSVAIGLSPLRQSRISCMLDVQDGSRCPFRVLEIAGSNPAPLERVRYGLCDRSYPGAPGCQPPYPVRCVYSMDTWVQAILPSPYRPGLDEQAAWWFRCVSPFRTCYFPLWLSPPGRSGDPGVSRSTLPVLHGDQKHAAMRRTITRKSCGIRCLTIKGAGIFPGSPWRYTERMFT